MSANHLLLLVAVVAFVLSAVGVGVDHVSLVRAGLASFASSFLV